MNGTLSLLKQAREAAKNSDDHDLKDKLSEVYDAVLELKEVIGNLREENADLRKRLEAKANLKWSAEKKLYFAEGDEDPFCPACLDKDGRQIRLAPHFSGPTEIWKYDCKVCNALFFVR